MILHSILRKYYKIMVGIDLVFFRKFEKNLTKYFKKEGRKFDVQKPVFRTLNRSGEQQNESKSRRANKE